MKSGMHLSAWELWVAAALVLAGAELLHGAFLLLAVAIACLPAALAGALGAGAALQIVCFAGALLAEIPLLARLFHRRRVRRLPTNADAIVGRRVTLRQPVSAGADGVGLLTGRHRKGRSLPGDLPPGAEAQRV